MPLNELTNNRPNNYSKWHRSRLPSECCMTDGDWFEQRKIYGKLQAVAYIETVQIPHNTTPLDYPIWSSKVSLAKQINLSMGIPAYIVWHTADCKVFYVQHIMEEKINTLDEIEYIQWIQKI